MPVSKVTNLQTGKVEVTQLSGTRLSATSILPFKVAFKTLPYPGYSPINPAPIGIAVIGFNNYIL